MDLRYLYRIYPTKAQINHFYQEIGNQRFVWNYYLAKEQNQYSENKKFNFYNSNATDLTKLKKEFEFLAIGDSTALQQTLRSLDAALKRSFKKISGFPKFKILKALEGSFTLVKSVGHDYNETHIKVPKVGNVKWKYHRELPTKPKTMTIIQDGNKWYVSLTTVVETQTSVEIENVVGIDFNSKDFVTSDGEAILVPKYLKRSKKLLARRQRQHAKCKKGSNNRRKRQLKVRNVYKKVKNQRKNFVHQTTAAIVKQYDLICIEDLNVKGMQKFNGSMIQDNGFAMMRSALQYKCIKNGKHLVVIGRFDPSSKACNNCGHIKGVLKLSDRTYDCTNCGYSLDRDLNAAFNIRDWGIKKYNNTVGTTGIQACGDTTVGDSNESRYVSVKQEA